MTSKALWSTKNIQNLALAVAALVLGIWLAFEFFAPTFEKKLEPSQISHHDGHRYNATLVLRRWERIYSLPSDGLSDHLRSGLELYEDGVPLGPAHVLHNDIVRSGEGRYSHWGPGLVFSSSDNSDPATNGRDYSIRATLEPHLVMRIGGVLALFVLAFLGARMLLARVKGSRDRTVDTAGRAASKKLVAKVASVVGGLIAIAWIAIEVFAPTFRSTLDPVSIQHGGGNRYHASVALSDREGIYALPYDAGAFPSRSHLLLYEDGRRLGPRHALHPEIGEVGLGQYSHWYDTVSFASSDNSDPSKNGRLYRVLAKLEPHSFIRIVGFLSLIVAGFAAVQVFAPNMGLSRMANRSGAALFDGALAASASAWAVAAAAVLFAAVPIIAYWSMLESAFTSGITLGGYFPISDASGYWGCANEYLEYGEADYWCHRRPIYSMLLSSVTLLSGRSLEIVLIVQAGLMGLCTFVFAREVARWLGALPAMLASFVIFQFAWLNALGVTMTEVGGLCVGLIAAALLLRAAERKSLWLGVLGAFMFGLGENIRPGALFALPLLLVWVATLKGFSVRSVAIGGLTAAAAIAASFSLHSLYVLIAGGDPGNSFSNTAMTIYGIAFGGDWTTLGADHPELLNETKESTQEIYRLAFDQIRARPDIFAQGLIYNVNLHMHQQWANLAFPLVPVVLLYLSGFAAALIAAWRSARARLVVVMLLGELFSAALIERDGGVRLWAVTGPLSHGIPPMIIVSAAARYVLNRAYKTRMGPAISEPAGSPLPFSVRAAGIIGVLLLAPVVNAALLPRAPEILSTVCRPGLQANIIDLDEMAVMTISDAFIQPASFPRRLSTDDLLASLGETGWYRDSIERLDDLRLLRGVSDAPRKVYTPGFYISADTPAPAGGRIVACADPNQVIEVANAPFMRIVSAQPADN